MSRSKFIKNSESFCHIPSTPLTYLSGTVLPSILYFVVLVFSSTPTLAPTLFLNWLLYYYFVNTVPRLLRSIWQYFLLLFVLSDNVFPGRSFLSLLQPIAALHP